jgi:hypothetical protein
MTTVVRVPTVHNQPFHQGVVVLKALRAAKVPVNGIMWPEGVRHGKLTLETIGGEAVYTWEPDPMLED